MNVGRLNSSSRSSRECVGSGTMPNIAIRTAPPAIHSVLRAIHGEKTSPSIRRAKNAFHSRDTAPRGARMTTGRDAIWKMEPKRLEDMKIPKHEAVDISKRSQPQRQECMVTYQSPGAKAYTRARE